jgi:hypothetical protein
MVLISHSREDKLVTPAPRRWSQAERSHRYLGRLAESIWVSIRLLGARTQAAADSLGRNWSDLDLVCGNAHQFDVESWVE